MNADLQMLEFDFIRSNFPFVLFIFCLTYFIFLFLLTKLCLHTIQNIVQCIQTNIVKSLNIATGMKKEPLII